MIRFGKSPQYIQKNPKINQTIQRFLLFQIIALVYIIFKDDIITLRNMVKVGNQDVIAIFNHYKKGNNDKENEKSSYLLIYKIKSNQIQKGQQLQIQTLQISQKKSCFDLWKPGESIPKNNQFRKNLINLSMMFNIEKLYTQIQNESKDLYQTNVSDMHFISLLKINQIILKLPSRAGNYQIEIDINEEDDIQSVKSNESILNQISQPLLLQSKTELERMKSNYLKNFKWTFFLSINKHCLILSLTNISNLRKSLNPLELQETENVILVNDSQNYYSIFNYQNYKNQHNHNIKIYLLIGLTYYINQIDQNSFKIIDQSLILMLLLKKYLLFFFLILEELKLVILHLRIN
ncbi:unnamed protein product [Paramecium sonneborni]|uniref:Transmembrane protein n=1 Tax=Paramecium sonneborni TaxID=65129 RepID=A0A8S1RMJ4_9CILI|nr:unnamed protein product [Paramecium sonneborni]